MRNLSDLIARGLKVKQAVLDGEIFALDEAGRPAFYDLMKRQCQAVCYGFDILCLNGRLRELSLVERKKILRTAIPRKLFGSGGGETFRPRQNQDLEGLVVKQKDGKYAQQTLWYKI